MHLRIAVAAAVATLLAVSPSAARADGWPDSGGFSIDEVDGACVITTTYDLEGRSELHFWAFLYEDRVILALSSLDWSSSPDAEYNVTYAFDRHVYTGDAKGIEFDGYEKGLTTRFGAEVLDDLAASRTLMVTKDDVVVAHLNMAGSGGAVATARRCLAHALRMAAAKSRAEQRLAYIAHDPFATPTPAAPAEHRTPVTQIQWARSLLPEYPSQAEAAGVTSGAVTLECTASANGGLSDCAVLSEFPADLGFGPAALAAAPSARVSSSTLQQFSDGPYRFTVRFTADR